MNLGLGLQAASAYFKEDDQRIQRERQAKVFDYDQARREADLQNLPKRTAVEGQRLDLASTQLTGEADRQPDVQATAAAKAKTDRSNAEFGLETVGTEQRIKTNQLKGQEQQSEFDLKQLPGKLQRAAVQGVLDQRGQSDVVLGTMAGLLARNDKAAVLQFSNELAKQGDVLPNSNGKQFVDVIPEKRADGTGYTFVTSTGERHFVPVEALLAAKQKVDSGKYKFLATQDGSVYSANESTGKVSQAYQGDPKTARGQQTPAEIQTMEYLVSKGVARDANQAWEMVRSAREKTRSSFIMDYVGKNAGLGQDASKLQADAGALYDSLRKGMGETTTSAPAAAPSGSTNWTEWAQ